MREPGGGGRERNDRIIAEPAGVPRASGGLSARLRQEPETFFVAATALEGKDVRILGWRDAADADALVDRAVAK